MPRYLNEDGSRVSNLRTEKAWIQINIKDKDIPRAIESYLVQPRVADYIELLESKINGSLPKLNKKR